MATTKAEREQVAARAARTSAGVAYGLGLIMVTLVLRAANLVDDWALAEICGAVVTIVGLGAGGGGGRAVERRLSEGTPGGALPEPVPEQG